MLIGVQFQLCTLTDIIPVQYVGLDHSLEMSQSDNDHSLPPLSL